MYGALNVLGEVPWQINRAVLAAVEQAWQAGGSFAQLPDRDAGDPLPDLAIPSFYQTVRTKHQLRFQARCPAEPGEAGPVPLLRPRPSALWRGALPGPTLLHNVACSRAGQRHIPNGPCDPGHVSSLV